MDRDPAPRQRRSSVPSTGQGRAATAFPGILFPNGYPGNREAGQPDFFTDLNLDRIVAAITAGREDYDLTGVFHMPLADVDAVAFRQEIMRDLEDVRLLADLGAFSETMRAVREALSKSEQATHRAAKQRWFLDAATLYGDGVARLDDDLARAPLASRGLSGFRDHVADYARSSRFRSLVAEAKEAGGSLASLRYRVGLFSLRVEVSPFDGEPDYGEEIDALFSRFRQADAEPYAFSLPKAGALSKVDAMILDRVAQMFPDAFARLAAFCDRNQDFMDPAIDVFEREVQFYVACRAYVERLGAAGVRFCYPQVSRDGKQVRCWGGLDLALAETLIGEGRRVVANDFDLSGPERILVVTGPNRGGKTSFARAFGQMHYLASLGCPVPGSEARLPLCDRVLTHFEKTEDIADLSGRLRDDLVRIRAILDAATPRSLVIINEILSSTTLRDAAVLSRRIAEALIRRDLLCVWVTFVDELAALDERTVSMVATVNPDRPTERTYRIVRREADGLAYALSVAEKHRLTGEAIEQRLKS